MSNNNGGCLSLPLALIVALALAAVAIGGAPNLASVGLSWDSSASIARSNARVEMNLQDNITRRVQSRNNSIVAERWAEVAGVVGVVLALAAAAVRVLPAVFASVATAFAAWAARPHRPQAPPAEIVRWAGPVLDAEPAARLEWVQERGYTGWAVVNDRTETVLLLEDGQRRA